MTDQVTWHHAKAEHRQHLMRFVCTPPAPRLTAITGYRDSYAGWWEREVQRAVRNLRPPYRSPEHLIVGLDSDGIAAASFFEELDGPRAFHLTYIAVANRWRYRSSIVAEGLVAETVAAMIELARSKGIRNVRFSAYIWPQNTPARKLCQRVGLTQNGQTEEGMDIWTGDLDASEDEFLW